MRVENAPHDLFPEMNFEVRPLVGITGDPNKKNLRQIFGRYGFATSVATIENGKKSIRPHLKPELLVIQNLRELAVSKNRYPGVPVLAILDHEDIVPALEAGADSITEYPIESGELTLRAARLIRSKKLQTETKGIDLYPEVPAHLRPLVEIRVKGDEGSKLFETFAGYGFLPRYKSRLSNPSKLGDLPELIVTQDVREVSPLKESHFRIPVLALVEQKDMERAREAGADSALAYPVQSEVMVLAAKELIHPEEIPDQRDQRVKIGTHLEFDILSGLLFQDNKPIKIWPAEAKILRIFVSSWGEPFSIDKLGRLMWPDKPMDPRHVKVIVSRLREILKPYEVSVDHSRLGYILADSSEEKEANASK